MAKRAAITDDGFRLSDELWGQMEPLLLCNDNFDVLRASITMAARDVSVWAGAGVGGHWV